MACFIFKLCPYHPMRIIRTLIHSSDTIMGQLAYCTFIDHTLLVVSIETISRVCHCCMRATFYKYTHAQTVFTLSIVINRAEHARSIVIIKQGGGASPKFDKGGIFSKCVGQSASPRASSY